jgi:hypothetical protein
MFWGIQSVELSFPEDAPNFEWLNQLSFAEILSPNSFLLVL